MTQEMEFHYKDFISNLFLPPGWTAMTVYVMEFWRDLNELLNVRVIAGSEAVKQSPVPGQNLFQRRLWFPRHLLIIGPINKCRNYPLEKSCKSSLPCQKFIPFLSSDAF